MATLAVQDMPIDGFTPTLVAAEAGGDEAEVGPGTFLFVKNGSAGAVTVTVEVPVAVGAEATVAPSVAAGDDLLVPLPVRNPAGHTGVIDRIVTDLATWTYSAVTSVTVAVVRAV